MKNDDTFKTPTVRWHRILLFALIPWSGLAVGLSDGSMSTEGIITYCSVFAGISAGTLIFGYIFLVRGNSQWLTKIFTEERDGAITAWGFITMFGGLIAAVGLATINNIGGFIAGFIPPLGGILVATSFIHHMVRFRANAEENARKARGKKK